MAVCLAHDMSCHSMRDDNAPQSHRPVHRLLNRLNQRRTLHFVSKIYWMEMVWQVLYLRLMCAIRNASVHRSYRRFVDSSCHVASQSRRTWLLSWTKASVSKSVAPAGFSGWHDGASSEWRWKMRWRTDWCGGKHVRTVRRRQCPVSAARWCLALPETQAFFQANPDGCWQNYAVRRLFGRKLRRFRRRASLRVVQRPKHGTTNDSVCVQCNPEPNVERVVRIAVCWLAVYL